MTDEEKRESEVEEDKLRRKTFEDLCNEARKRQVSSSENFDKSILTYSASGLALSLTFLKDFVPINQALQPWLLFSSWSCFVIAILLTTLSFSVSYKAQTKSMELYEEYYINKKEDFFNKKSFHDKLLNCFNFLSGSAFISAIIFTSIFIGINLKTANEILDKKTVSASVFSGKENILEEIKKSPPTITKFQKTVESTTVNTKTVTTTTIP